MKEKIKSVDTNNLRVNLTRYLKNDKGTTFYITRYNKLVGELKIYTEQARLKNELEILKRTIDEIENGIIQKV